MKPFRLYLLGKMVNESSVCATTNLSLRFWMNYACLKLFDGNRSLPGTLCPVAGKKERGRGGHRPREVSTGVKDAPEHLFSGFLFPNRWRSLVITAPMMTMEGLPFSLRRSAKALQMGLKRMADMAGKNSALRMRRLPALLIGVRVLPLVPLWKMRGVTPA
jgi:hypothetical protein